MSKIKAKLRLYMSVKDTIFAATTTQHNEYYHYYPFSISGSKICLQR